MAQGTLAQDYSALATYRDPYLQAARDNSALTIPALVPPEDNGVKKTRKTLRQPDDSTGSRGVNNLASKLLISVLPANAPVFRLIINDLTVKRELAEQVGSQGTSEVQKALGQVERVGMQEIDATGVRGPAFVMIQHLLVAGNYALNVDHKTGQVRGYPLQSFVVSRDRMGNLMRGIIEEVIAYGALTPDLQDAVKTRRMEAGGGTETSKEDLEAECRVYTCVKRTTFNRFRVWQEVEGVRVDGSEGSYSEDTCPYMFVRLIPVDGEDYGRAYVSDLYGDLFNANELRRAIVSYSRTAAKVVYLVKPNATTKPKKLTDAKSGDFVTGNPDDVVALSLEKTQDFNVARAVYEDIKRALELSFLLNSTVQRQAERVTAEEVRAVIEELNTGLGGVQSLLATEFQLPFVKITLKRLERKKLFKLPPGIVTPTIVTGIAALGRSQDLQNFVQALTALGLLQQVPQELRARIKPEDFMNRIFTAAGVDPDGLFMTEEEFAQEQQKAVMMQMMQQAGPGAVQQVTKGVMDQQTEQVRAEAPAA